MKHPQTGLSPTNLEVILADQGKDSKKKARGIDFLSREGPGEDLPS